jgi:hypothetical protein
MAKFEHEHSVEMSATASAVWELYREVSRWVEWDTGLDEATLDGPFEVGSAGVMHIAGLGPIGFRLVEVEPGVSFTDETVVEGAVVRFAHRLEPLPGGRLRVTHRVEVEGPAAGALGPAIVEDLPEALAALAKLAEGSSPA